MPAPSSPLILGLDVGTTNIKGVAYAPDGRAVASADVPTISHHPRPRWAFYRPDELWDQCVRVLRGVVGQLDDPRRIAGIAVASVGETGFLLDDHGEPLTEAIAWFDQRTDPQAAWLEREVGQDALFAFSGLALQPIFGLCKLLWHKQHEPHAYARAARWLHVADYVAFRLCGEAATDVSLASRSLMLDLRGRIWHEGILEAAGIRRDLLAPLVVGGTRLGPVTAEAARLTGLPETVQVSAGGHDHVCGALAVGVVEPGKALASLGTTETLLLPTREPMADPELSRQGYSQGAHVVPDRYYAYGGQYTFGACIEWLRDIVGRDVAYATLIAEAGATPPGSLGVCFLPHLRLANPPDFDPRSRGAFVGLSADAGRGALTRAVFEGLCCESRHAAGPLLAAPETTPPVSVIAIGGPTRNALLMRIKAAVSGQTQTVAEVEEATALGAAVLGGIGAGVYRDAAGALATLSLPTRAVEPDPGLVPFYDRLYREVYDGFYRAVRPLHHALAGLRATDDGPP